MELVADAPAPLDAALKYARLGWPVFPVHYPTNGDCSCGDAACENPAKHPMTATGFKDASREHADVMRWWNRWPAANIGIATGAAGIVVLDIDPRHSGDTSLEALIDAHGEFDVPTVLTGGGGQHLYFRATAAVSSRANALGAQYPGIDVRGQGGYVLAPPSVHASGRLYAWEVSSPRKLAPLPPWLAALLAPPERKPIEGVDDGGIIRAGGRNATLTRYAGRLRRLGTDPAEIAEALLAVNRRRVQPPLDEREVMRIAESVGRYAPHEVPLATPEQQREEFAGAIDVADVPRTVDTDRRRYAIGIASIDQRAGLLRPGGFTVIGARQGVGKTALLETSIIANAGRYRIFCATLEMLPEDIRDRMVARIMGRSLDDVERMRKEHSPDPKFRAAHDVVEGLGLTFYHPKEREKRSARAMMEAAMSWGADMLAIDYTRRIAHWRNSKRDADEIVEGLSDFAKDTRVHVVLLSQLNRGAQDVRPNASQLQDTGLLEQEADRVILIHRPFVGQGGDNIAEVIVAKNRRGPVFKSHVHWHGPTQTFTPMEAHEEAEARCCSERKKRRAERYGQ